VTTLLASALYLPRLDTPRGAVWDENYYVTAIQRQVDHRAQFASHPPLGFLLSSIAPRLGPIRAAGEGLADRKTLAGATIPPGYDFARTRIGSALAGVLGATTFFALMLALTDRLVLALGLANLFTFENAFLVQFRAAQLDSFLMLFSLLALLTFTLSFRRLERARPGLDLAFGAAVGLAAMVKLIGVWLVLAGPLLLVARLRAATRERSLATTLIALSRSTVLMSAGFVGATALVYAAQTADAVRPPDPATPAGARDQGFVSPAHGAWLAGRVPYSARVVAGAARDDLNYVLSDLHGVPRTDPNGSWPGEWPLMRRTIDYRWDGTSAKTRYVQLVGNPVGWGVGLIGLLVAPLLVLRARSGPRRVLALALLLLWGWVMGLHVWLAQTRVMYLYHYFPALILSWCLAALACSEALERLPTRRAARTALSLTALLHLAGFWFWSPMTFGRELSAAQCQARNTLIVQVHCRSSIAQHPK
jgi:dolichyl-phosphate-mannose--protein O-mannosyl transferase